MTPPNKSSFVQKLTASAQKHAEELFEQNERLKSLVASLEEKQTQISEELSSLRETAYLMRSPTNARRLLDAMERLETGGGDAHDLAETD